jgi:hypothetical protein
MRLCGLVVVVVALSLSGGRAQEEVYVPLFNGKDLTGWTYDKKPLAGKTETPDKRFQVVDGVIVANEGKGIKELATAREFDTDFQLKLEFRAAPRADSGVYIRGTQLQVRDYPTVGPYKNLKNFKNGDWNDLDISVTGNTPTTTVNGMVLGPKDLFELVVKDGKTLGKLNGQPVDVGSLQVSRNSVAVCKCNGEVVEAAFKVPAKGTIGLQAEVGKFEFRNVRVRKLP